MSLNGERMKKIGVIALCVALFFSLIFVKIYLSSRHEFIEAEMAYSKGDYREAVVHYERAILWYLPVGGYVKRSAERLWEVGEIFEDQDAKLALEAYRSLRSAFYAARSFYTPGGSWIRRTDEKIAGLVAKEPAITEEDRNKSEMERKKEALAVLRRPMKPHTGWSIVLEIGFWGWIAGTLLFIFRAFNMEQQLNMKRGLFWGGIVILFYALWIVGMMNA